MFTSVLPHPVSADENVSVHSSVQKRRHNTHARRQRFRYQNSSLGHSHRSAAREAARRISHQSPAVHSSRVVHVHKDENAKPQQQHSSLPRYLKRPAFRSISPTAIATIEPKLKGVAIEFIQRKINDMGEEMFSVAKQTVTKCPKGRLPRELEVVINDMSAAPPTHLFAVYSQPSALQKERITFHPAHALILAANCANLPPLPYSKPVVQEYAEFAVTLPVIPLSIPNPDTFPYLLEYLYTQRTDDLLRSLLPISSQDAIPSPEQLTRRLARSHSKSSLRPYMQRIYGLYTNVTALGVFDENLWRTMEAAWEVVHASLA